MNAYRLGTLLKQRILISGATLTSSGEVGRARCQAAILVRENASEREYRTTARNIS
jgi:hypothetical protein